MNKAIFFDRDGVINHPKKNYYVFKPEDFILNKGVIEFMSEMEERGYLLFVITNQGGVAKGKYSLEQVEHLHEYMKKLLSQHHIHITEIFVCPHHNKIENCLCRKPKPLMLEKAIAQFDIDPELSWFIGDKKSDVIAGEAAGVNTIKILKNKNLTKIISRIP